MYCTIILEKPLNPFHIITIELVKAYGLVGHLIGGIESLYLTEICVGHIVWFAFII